MDSMRFAGKTALVTGAASGIGKEVVDTFVKGGARVVAADKAFPLAAVGFVGQTRSVHLDVSREVDWENLLKEIIQLDVVVACAGISEAKPILDTSLCDWQRVMAANLDGAFLTVRYGAKAMLGRGGGAIVLVGSASGIKAVSGASAYCCSKAGHEC